MKFGLVALLALGILWAQAVRPEAARLFERQQYREAATLLERQVAEQPKSFPARMLLGLCRLQTNEPAKAEKEFLAAIRLQQSNAGAYYSLARARFLLGRFDEALQATGEAARLGERPARVDQLRGRIEEERGNFETALGAYQKALAADGSLLPARIGEASVLYKLGRYREARDSAEMVLRRAPDDPQARRIVERATELTPSASAAAVPKITLTARHAIDFRLEHSPTPEKNLISTMAGGLAVFDYDGDGRMDLFFANGAELPSLRKTGPRFWNRIYRNLGDWKFEDVTRQQGLAGEGFALGAAAGDFDGDGRPDLFVPAVPRGLLYRNTPQGFLEISAQAGVRTGGWPMAAAWIDYNRDGLLDLFVVRYVDWTPAFDLFCGDREKSLRVYCHPSEFRGLTNQLFRNLGGGKFEDVSQASGIAAHTGKGMSVAVLDADADGWPDLFVTNDTVPNFLFRNQGDGTFEEAGLRFGVAMPEEGRAISSMGVDARDYDNDGRPDLLVTALTGENFPLFRNHGSTGFSDATFPSRLGIGAARRSGWGVAFADLDNNGWKDAVTANSHVTDNIHLVRDEKYKETNTIFLNRNGIFSAPQEFAPAAAHRGMAVADLDNDGRLDIVVTVLGEKPELWRNETKGGNWLKVKLAGNAIGARVRAGSQWQEQTSTAGYTSSNLDVIHFGLGDADIVNEVEIHWPDGRKQLLKNVRAGQTIAVGDRARPD